jgi:hypothetical protein
MGLDQDEKGEPPLRREYPKLYEKLVPIALGILAFIIVVLLLLILAVLGGLFPAGG